MVIKQLSPSWQASIKFSEVKSEYSFRDSMQFSFWHDLWSTEQQYKQFQSNIQYLYPRKRNKTCKLI